MITWERDLRSGFSNIEAYDMWVDGVRTYAWLCHYRSGGWKFKGAELHSEFKRRATREEAETDALAWWAAKQLEEMR